MFVHIIFFLIKLIGWILLILLGLIVGLLLIVLLVPIRYRLRLSHGEEFHLDSTVSWLLHIVHASITQEGELRRVILRVFGIVIYDSTKPIKPKKRKPGRARKRKTHSRGSILKRLKKRRKASANTRGQRKTVSLSDESGVEALDKNKKRIKERREPATESTIEKGMETVAEAGTEMTTKMADEMTELKDKLKPKDKNIMESIEASDDISKDEYKDEFKEEPEEEPKTILGKLFGKVKAIVIGIRHFFHRVVEKIKSLFEKAIDIQHKINLVKAFINEDDNRAAFGVTYDKLKKILKHIKPTTLRSRLIFGTGDPCSTGQALGMAGILYGIYGDHIQITPDFENKIFKGSHYARGRIRTGTLLIIVIRLLLDKKFKLLLRNYRILKEAL